MFVGQMSWLYPSNISYKFDMYPEKRYPKSRHVLDVTYISSMWNLANIVQSTLCTPRSLSLPISSSPTQRTSLIASFHRIYMSFPAPFRTFTEASICDLARRSKRLARQTLFLTSNYFHCLMLIYADEHEQLSIDVQGTLDAAHEAINSFFLLRALFEDEAKVWYHFQYRAFSEAVSICPLRSSSQFTRSLKLIVKQ